MKTLKMGTRGSLLAQAQSNFIAREIEEKLNVKVEKVLIKTTGDRVTNVPLHAIGGDNVFTRELDTALLAGEIDFCVHSYKDLGTKRPAGIQLCATPPRDIPNDVLLMNPKFAKQNIFRESNQRSQLNKITIGTSSPRRRSQLKSHLAKILPFVGPSTSIECKDLRGNINTRIEKLLDGHSDAIVLAAAGLNRLAMHPDTNSVATSILRDLSFCFLPPQFFTPAPSQGILAIECRETDHELFQLLNQLNDKKTQINTKIERDRFQVYGGTCHLPMGIYANDHEIFENGELDQTIVQNRILRTQSLTEVSQKFHLPKKNEKVFIGLPSNRIPKSLRENVLSDRFFATDQYIDRKPLEFDNETLKKISDAQVKSQKILAFVSSQHCIHALDKIPYHFLATPGIATAQALNQVGKWAHFMGAGEQGLESSLDLINSELFRALQGLNRESQDNGVTNDCLKIYLTSKSSKAKIPKDWHRINVYDIRERHSEYSANAHFKVVDLSDQERHQTETQLSQIKKFYWSSSSQFKFYQKLFPDLFELESKNQSPKHHKHHSVHHFCGTGKTATELLKLDTVSVTPIPDWRYLCHPQKTKI